MPSRFIFHYLLLTFLITWSIIGFYVFDPAGATARFGEISGSHPLFFIATWAPAVSASILVLSHGGIAGLGRFAARLFLWRASKAWAAFVFVGLPLVFIAGSLIRGGPLLAPLPRDGVGAAVAVLFMMLMLGPVEEFGWRGFLQPMLQRHMTPIRAGVLIGSIWGIWHLPAFFLAGTVFGGWDFLPFFLGNVVIAVLVTPLFNRTGGSLLWPMLFHWQLINPFWPDARPWDTWILAAVAVPVVWCNRDSMLHGRGAVTEVVPDPPHAARSGKR
jgi:membrane protease YdiL (CAAX protease family)